ncbi:MAG: hypothetical protein K6T94_17245 [Paenibacillus sp.]|nr:hypothetical protein [Paenibacillus sp.]
MKINKRIFNLSAWIALIAIIFIPGRVMTDGTLRTEFGFPFRFFIQYHDIIKDSKWFANGANIQLLYYFVNVIYGVIMGFLFLRNKFRR